MSVKLSPVIPIVNDINKTTFKEYIDGFFCYRKERYLLVKKDSNVSEVREIQRPTVKIQNILKILGFITLILPIIAGVLYRQHKKERNPKLQKYLLIKDPIEIKNTIAIKNISERNAISKPTDKKNTHASNTFDKQIEIEPKPASKIEMKAPILFTATPIHFPDNLFNINENPAAVDAFFKTNKDVKSIKFNFLRKHVLDSFLKYTHPSVTCLIPDVLSQADAEIIIRMNDSMDREKYDNFFLPLFSRMHIEDQRKLLNAIFKRLDLNHPFRILWGNSEDFPYLFPILFLYSNLESVKEQQNEIIKHIYTYDSVRENHFHYMQVLPYVLCLSSIEQRITISDFLKNLDNSHNKKILSLCLAISQQILDDDETVNKDVPILRPFMNDMLRHLFNRSSLQSSVAIHTLLDSVAKKYLDPLILLPEELKSDLKAKFNIFKS